MSPKTDKHITQERHAETFLQWLRERGGIAVWRSINLSNPGASWSTPALEADGKPYGRPNWQTENTPHRIITDAEDVLVLTPREVKRFHVAVRVGSQGLTLKVTDASTRRIRKAVDKAGEGAWYEFDYSTQEAVIYVPDAQVTLAEWARRQGR